MGRKLRLLLFEDCDRKCRGCCNKQFDLKNLPICEDYSGYDLIMLTGGEPMLKPDVVLSAVANIRLETDAPIYLYTAKTTPIYDLRRVLSKIEGLTVTLHKQEDQSFWNMFDLLGIDYGNRLKSFRLNVFKGVSMRGIESDRWEIKKNIKWMKNCPLPEGEVFMRYNGGSK